MKKVFLLMMTAAVIWGFYLASPYRREERAAIQLARPQVMDIRDTVTLQGTVIDPERKKVYPEGASCVLAVYVQPGEPVKAGQVLMRLERINDEQEAQAATVSALGKIKDTLENGDLSGAETMLEDVLKNGPASVQRNSEENAYQLYSPVNGMVMSVSVQAGEDVSPLFPCIQVSDLNTLMIEASANEEVIGKLREELDCEISIPAFSLSGLQGKVSSILPYAQQTGVINSNSSAATTVRIALSKQNTALRPGYRATVKVITSRRKSAVLIPYEAVFQDETGQEYVKKAVNNIVVKQNILTGAELEETVETIQGVAPEDVLVLSSEEICEGAFIEYAALGHDGDSS